MSYPEALKYLAKKYGIEIKERELSSEEKLMQSERESLFIVNNFARDYFQIYLKTMWTDVALVWHTSAIVVSGMTSSKSSS